MVLSEKQEEFLLAADKRINLLSGSVRSGKTWVSLLKWGLFVAESPMDASFLMAGRTMGALNRNCLTLLKSIVGSENFVFSIHLKQGKLFGRTVWFEDANDITSEQKIRGLTLMGAYLDELTILRRDFYNMLLSRLSAPGAKLFATTNPDGPRHWVMTDIIACAEKDVSVWEFRMCDNPALDKGYIEAISKEYDGFLYDRFILGRWVAPEGAIYRRFIAEKDSFHIGDTDRFVFEQINVGVDFGGSRSGHAFVACGIGRARNSMNMRYETESRSLWDSAKKEVGGLDNADSDGYVSGDKLVIVALASERHFGSDIDPDALYRLIADFIMRVHEKYGHVENVYCDGAEPVLIRGLRADLDRRVGIKCAVRAVKKRRIIDRIRATISLLAAKRLFFTSDCETLENALSDAVWSECENSRLDDGTSDIDTLDAFEYSWSRETERLIAG